LIKQGSYTNVLTSRRAVTVCNGQAGDASDVRFPPHSSRFSLVPGKSEREREASPHFVGKSDTVFVHSMDLHR